VSGVCTGCGACAQSCKVKAAQVQNGWLHIDRSKCIECGVCVKNCPHQILSIKRQGYAVYVGGKIGRIPMLGTKLIASIAEEEAVFYIETILDVYQQLSLEGERIGTVIKRIGLENFREELFKKASFRKLR
jgi:dissimilatory sulfite reductase (desulfoviridin) alpha/beta subunit